jgi:hypothetical protein
VEAIDLELRTIDLRKGAKRAEHNSKALFKHDQVDNPDTAPVVMYSTAISSWEDAPHGMEFLFNRYRLSVATSRARCVCILVGNPGFFEPECRTPEQMRMANALCRYLELATFCT